MTALKLGLIGDNIGRSRSPLLHVLAGRLCGLEVTYDRLIPADLGQSFDAVFEDCRTGGYRGINVTYPYKEQVVGRVRVPDPGVAAIGACNTVLFDPAGPVGHNTDHSGFQGGYRACFGAADPGRVAMIGAGGVGRAIAFALAGLGCRDLRLVDRDPAKAHAVRDALAAAAPAMTVTVPDTVAEAVRDADGLINCTPLGMVGHAGTAIPRALIGGQRWAFDAVYTPINTAFLTDARAAGLAVMSGELLFFHQGIDAFHLFTGQEVDAVTLRRLLTGTPSDDEAVA